jgi:hypothetical protein
VRLALNVRPLNSGVMRRFKVLLVSLGCVACVTQGAGVPDSDPVHERCGADSEQWVRMEAPPPNREELLRMDATGTSAGAELQKVQDSKEVWFSASQTAQSKENLFLLACSYGPQRCHPTPTMVAVEYEIVQGRVRVRDVLMEVCVN